MPFFWSSLELHLKISMAGDVASNTTVSVSFVLGSDFLEYMLVLKSAPSPPLEKTGLKPCGSISFLWLVVLVSGVRK